MASEPVRAPLGALYEGFCRVGDTPIQPSATILADRCNQGYARCMCPHFPGADAPDAVRFCVIAESAGTLSIRYVVEKNHGPFEQGVMSASEIESNLSEAPLIRQARAYLASYKRLCCD